MKVVIDTIADSGGCRARIVEIVGCDEGMLLVRENGRPGRISLEIIVDWAPVDIGVTLTWPLGTWIRKRDPGFICF